MSRRQRLADCTYDEIHPTFKLFADRMPRELAKAMRDDPSILDTMVRTGRSRLDLVHNMYLPIDKQADIWRTLNREQGWGLAENSLYAAESESRKLGDWPENHARVIVPYLPEKDGNSGVRRTFGTLWTLAIRNFRHSRLEYDLSPSESTVETYEEMPEPGFRLEVIEWVKEGGQGMKTVIGKQVNRGGKHVHAGGLACAALNPEWLRQYSCIEWIKLFGYKIILRTNDADCVPTLCYTDDEERQPDCIELNVRKRVVNV